MAVLTPQELPDFQIYIDDTHIPCVSSIWYKDSYLVDFCLQPITTPSTRKLYLCISRHCDVKECLDMALHHIASIYPASISTHQVDTCINMLRAIKDFLSHPSSYHLQHAQQEYYFYKARWSTSVT